MASGFPAIALHGIGHVFEVRIRQSLEPLQHDLLGAVVLREQQLLLAVGRKEIEA